MKAEIISIGDELLIGQTINTNASYLGSELALMNIKVENCQTISDSKQAIFNSFDLAFNRSDLIIVTGGLGPTKDDITKHVLCEYFDTELEINTTVLVRIEEFFRKRKRPMLDVNIRQAELPKKCQIIENIHGTASGMWFEKDGKVLLSLPGVPYEMKGIMQDFAFEKIKQTFKVNALYHKTILTTGIGESYLAEEMQDWEERILSEGLSLAYLPSPGMVKLRISSNNGELDKSRIDVYFEELKLKLPEFVYGFENETLTQIVGQFLKDSQKTISTVESCTGGGIAHELTRISGSSDYFVGGLVTYSVESKVQLVGVDQSFILNFGVVSKEVAVEMAQKGRVKMNTDFCISSTGYAEPSEGLDQDLVGTIWIAVASKDKIVSKKLIFGDNRERNIKMTIFAALNLFRFSFLEKKL